MKNGLKVLHCVIPFCSKMGKWVCCIRNGMKAYLNSSDNNGNRKAWLAGDTTVFDTMPHLKHLTLVYKKCYIDY